MSKSSGAKEKISYFGMLVFLLPKLVKAAPVLAVVINMAGILHGMSHGFEMIVNQYLFDAITACAGSRVAEGLLAPVLAFGLLYISKTFLNGVHNFFWNPWYFKVSGTLNLMLSEKCAQIDPVSFENPELLDDIEKAKGGVDNAFAIPSNFLTIFTFYIPFFIVSATFLFSLKPLLLVLMIAMFIPAVCMLIVRTRLYANLEDAAAPLRRKYEYFESAVCGRESYKETRLFGAFDFFKKLYRESMLFLNKEVWKTEKKTVFIELGLRLFMLCGYMGILSALFYYLMRGEITVGSFAAVFSSMGLLCSIIEEIVVRHMGNMAKDLGKVQNLIRFMEMPVRGGSMDPINHGTEIELRHVSFKYPGADGNAIENVSIKIMPGETLAIVGENGAGKTTLVRLICGLFTPDEGQVLIDGKSTADIAPERLYENTSAVFQRVQHYQMTLRDNVDISGVDGNITASLGKADLDISSAQFPQGAETMLSREFDGIDLSGGQWQRVAIARGLHRTSDVILLDEPTAAIDPIEEARTYERFMDISKGKTSIIVTHRMGSVKIADRILVMDKGRTADIGTHSELMTKEGLYAQMWDAQAKWYA